MRDRFRESRRRNRRTHGRSPQANSATDTAHETGTTHHATREAIRRPINSCTPPASIRATPALDRHAPGSEPASVTIPAARRLHGQRAATGPVRPCERLPREARNRSRMKSKCGPCGARSSHPPHQPADASIGAACEAASEGSTGTTQTMRRHSPPHRQSIDRQCEPMRSRLRRHAVTHFRDAEKEKPRKSKNLRGLFRHVWRRRRDSNPRSRFWPRCSLSRGVPSTSRPRLPNLRSRQGGSATKPRFYRVTGPRSISATHFLSVRHENSITPGRVRMPCAAHGLPTPYTSRRSAPKS